MRLNLPFTKDEDLPSLEQITKGIAIIEENCNENSSYEAIRKIFIETLGMIPKVIAPNATLSAPIYRVTDGLFSGFNKNEISFFSHPPAEYCRQGRANLAGFPVFYAALSAVTALREFRSVGNTPVKKEDILYISKWEVDKKSQYSYSQFTYDESINLGEHIVDINTANKNKLGEIYSVYSEDKRRAINTLLEKLGNFFILDKVYNISSFLSHYLLYEDRESMPIKIDALLYPSVQAGFKGINYAIHPEFSKKNVILKQVQKVAFNSFQDDSSNLTLLEVGIPQSDGTIKWFYNGFNFNNIEIKTISVSFYNGPPIDQIKEDNLFYEKSTDKACNLLELVLNILKKTQEAFFNKLSEFEEPIDYEKVYEKALDINIPENKIFTKTNNVKYFVSIFRVNIRYKPVLIDIEE